MRVSIVLSYLFFLNLIGIADIILVYYNKQGKKGEGRYINLKLLKALLIDIRGSYVN